MLSSNRSLCTGDSEHNRGGKSALNFLADKQWFCSHHAGVFNEATRFLNDSRLVLEGQKVDGVADLYFCYWLEKLKFSLCPIERLKMEHPH